MQRIHWHLFSFESVGVTSHPFLSVNGCPADTAPVSLFSIIIPILSKVQRQIQLITVVLVTQRYCKEWRCSEAGEDGALGFDLHQIHMAKEV